MTLSKQLYSIILVIFFMIFTGNFIISVNTFKDYLESESTTKSQDTATSLGMTLKSLINNKTDSEITSIIRAIANRGFYKEIRLEDVQFNFTSKDLLDAVTLNDTYQIKDLKVLKSDGEIVSSKEESALENELAQLEDDTSIIQEDVNTKETYSFIPSANFLKHQKINISFTAYNESESKQMSTRMDINQILVKVSREEKFDEVPQWFIDALPMKMIETSSEISDGWKTQAVIYVSANAGEAYLKLYEQAKNAILYAIVAFVLSMILLVIFLRLILRSLKNIETLAIDISNGQFDTIKKIPFTTELKNVSLAMNDMSDKIENIIGKLNNNLEKMTTQISKDDLTGLQLEQTFQTDMKQMFIKKEDGYIVSVKIDNLADFAKNNSHAIVDKFLKEFALVLNTCDGDGINAYRFFGSTFALISKKVNEKDIQKLIENLKVAFEKLSKEYNINNVANIGVTPFNPISTTDAILASANEAYEMAKQIGFNESYIRDKNDLARDMLEWKELIFDIIDNKKFSVKYINQALDMDTQSTTLIEEAFTSANDKNDETIPIGTFISIAEQYNKVIDFDKAVIEEVIKYITSKNITNDVLINLAFDSVLNDEFKSWLKRLLSNYKDVASQLCFSITAYGCTRDIDAFKKFIRIVHRSGANIIIKRFETKFIPLDSLKEFNLDYIRLARDYTNGISNDVSKQNFVESICDLSKLLNIKVYAESVKDDESFKKLKELGLHGASK